MTILNNLNLLPALHILLKERHVSRASKAIGLSQPAMSRVLAKLREQFKDDLLVKAGNEYQLTSKANKLKQELNRLIPELQKLDKLEQNESFCPTKIEQLIRIAGTDMDILLLTENIHSIQKAAPLLSLSFKQSQSYITNNVLSGELDFAISATDDDRSGLYRSVLWSQSYVVIVDKNSQYCESNFTLQEYLESKHGVFNLSDNLLGKVDIALTQQNLKRNIVLQLPTFVQIPALLADSSLMFTVPEKFAQYLAKHHSVKVLPLPLEVAPLHIYLYWHRRLHQSPIHQWLRKELKPKAN